MKRVFIDIETYCEVDIKASGAYRYIAHPSFEVLLIAYAIDDQPVQVLDLAQGDWDDELKEILENEEIELVAHNAAFERPSLNKHFGINVPVDRWTCTMAMTARSGYPLGLDQVSKAMNLEQAKMAEGKRLITYFCTPCKPTKTNKGRTRNLPEHDINKWEAFKEYCRMDVEAEREIYNTLESKFPTTKTEKAVYCLDQTINDRGVLLDKTFIEGAVDIDERVKAQLLEDLKRKTALENPNSDKQLTGWLSYQLQRPITSVAKGPLAELIAECKDEPEVLEVLKLRKEIGKTSNAKYGKMLDVMGDDQRARGHVQYYGASRTGRFAGRLIQTQNLPRNYLDGHMMDVLREDVRGKDLEAIAMKYNSPSDTLSQLIRTSFIAPEGSTFAIVDYGQIEARVAAWCAGQTWMLEDFEKGNDVYISTAAAMYNVPRESIEKGSDLRNKGKVAVLAGGYGGGVSAFKNFAKLKDFVSQEQIETEVQKMRTKVREELITKDVIEGLAEDLFDAELQKLVNKWRASTPNIVKFWRKLNAAAMRVAETATAERVGFPGTGTGLTIRLLHKCLTIELPSGRRLCYQKPHFTTNRFGEKSLAFWGINDKKVWGRIETYGGKLTENIVQAIARDLLCEVMLRVDKKYPIVMHIHDELVAEVSKETADQDLAWIVEEMAKPIAWAPGLPTMGDGYLTSYYKKD